MILLPGLRQLISLSSDDETFDFFIPEDALAVVLPQDDHVFHHGRMIRHRSSMRRLPRTRHGERQAHKPTSIKGKEITSSSDSTLW